MKFSKFFSNLQESPWYREFLNPVMNCVGINSTLLDIGTGSGKMLEILFLEKNVNSVGTDTNRDMLNEAKIKLKNTTAELHLIKPGEPLKFEKHRFDYITICNVLFNLKKPAIDFMVEDALSLLKKNGQLLILTPTGKGNSIKLTRHYLSYKNKGIYVWYRATKKSAKNWTSENYLAGYTAKNKLKYKREFVMNGFAQLEIIER